MEETPLKIQTNTEKYRTTWDIERETFYSKTFTALNPFVISLVNVLVYNVAPKPTKTNNECNRPTDTRGWARGLLFGFLVGSPKVLRSTKWNVAMWVLGMRLSKLKWIWKKKGDGDGTYDRQFTKFGHTINFQQRKDSPVEHKIYSYINIYRKTYKCSSKRLLWDDAIQKRCKRSVFSNGYVRKGKMVTQ